MAKDGKSRGGRTPGGKPPKSAARVGSGSRGRQGGKISGAKGAGQPAGQGVPTAPAFAGPPDVVQQRMAQATQGKMEQNQLRKNRSTGIKLRKG